MHSGSSALKFFRFPNVRTHPMLARSAPLNSILNCRVKSDGCARAGNEFAGARHGSCYQSNFKLN